MSNSATPWTMASQAPLPMGFSRQEHWSGLPFPSPRYIVPYFFHNISSVQLLHCVRLIVTPWTAAHQASLPITSYRSLLKLMSIESVMPSNHLILCVPFSSCPQSFPASGSFQMSQFFTSGGQSIGVSASTSVLPMNIKD